VGCDIHLYVEVRERGVACGDAQLQEAYRRVRAHPEDQEAVANIDRLTPWGPWQMLRTKRRGGPRATEGPLTDLDELLRGPDGQLLEPEIVLYDSRHYALFAWLANVRNYDGIQPILSTAVQQTTGGFVLTQSGVPGNATEAYKQEVDDWDDDAHSHRWLTIRQVLEADLSGEFTRSGLVSLGAFSKLQRGTIPDSWSRGAFGPQILSESQALERLAKMSKAKILEVENQPPFGGSGPLVEASWKVHKSAFAAKFRLMCQQLSDRFGLDGARLCFFFDN